LPKQVGMHAGRLRMKPGSGASVQARAQECVCWRQSSRASQAGPNSMISARCIRIPHYIAACNRMAAKANHLEDPQHKTYTTGALHTTESLLPPSPPCHHQSRSDSRARTCMQLGIKSHGPSSCKLISSVSLEASRCPCGVSFRLQTPMVVHSPLIWSCMMSAIPTWGAILT